MSTSLLTPDDLFLFNQGTHYRLYDKLGAHVTGGGTHFAVWAPNALAISVIGDWNDWNRDADPMAARDDSGIWEVFVPSLGHGARYKFAITAPDGRVLDKADPYATRCEHPPATASVIWEPHHAWKDGEWMRTRAQRNARNAPISIYECHLGSWRRRRGGVLGYREIGAQLAHHVTQLGFTHVELMPVMEHPFYGSWGYQVTGFFAPTTRFGAPDDLMAMIDELHRRGVGVILDWVPAHFPTDAHGLGEFDGTHLYEHADPRRGFHPDWTSYIFNYGRHEVRSFLISSAMSWLERYHVDGLRVDGVASMLYRNYSRKDGEWLPNEDGSNHDRDAIAFLQQFNKAVYTAFPDVQTYAEESTSWGGATMPPEVGGLGFGFKWDLGWMHDTLAHVAREPIFRKYHYRELTFRSLYVNADNFVLPLSHDEVVHLKKPIIAKIPGDPWQKYATMRLVYGFQWTLPGKKLLFMGDEIGVWKEWNHDEELDWAVGLHPAHAGIARWVGDCNGMYRRYRSLYAKDCAPVGMQWLEADDVDHGVIAYLRTGRDDDAPVIAICNFTPVVREGYRIGAPAAGFWREVLCSDAEIYGGSGVGNKGGVSTDDIGFKGWPCSMRVTAPPLGCSIFVWEGGAA